MVGEAPASGTEKYGDSEAPSPLIFILLVTETKISNEPPIPLRVCPPQVFKEAAAASNHFQEAAATMVIFLVFIEVAPKVVDSGCQEGNLD
jgi:hypothetical protein